MVSLSNIFLQRCIFSLLFLLQFGKIVPMELREEIQAYLERTDSKAAHLAKEADVSPSLISRILAGKQNDLAGRNLKKIERVIRHGA